MDVPTWLPATILARRRHPKSLRIIYYSISGDGPEGIWFIPNQMFYANAEQKRPLRRSEKLLGSKRGSAVRFDKLYGVGATVKRTQNGKFPPRSNRVISTVNLKLE